MQMIDYILGPSHGKSWNDQQSAVIGGLAHNSGQILPGLIHGTVTSTTISRLGDENIGPLDWFRVTDHSCAPPSYITSECKRCHLLFGPVALSNLQGDGSRSENVTRISEGHPNARQDLQGPLEFHSLK